MPSPLRLFAPTLLLLLLPGYPSINAHAQTSTFIETEINWGGLGIVNADYYHVQVSPDTAFSTITFEDDRVPGTQLSVVISLPADQRFFWRVRAQVDNTVGPWSQRQSLVTSTSSAPDPAAPAERLVLEAPYPNPARTAATIPFHLPRPARVTLDLMDLRGRRVATLIARTLPAGRHAASWNAAAFPAGVYVVRLSTASSQAFGSVLRVH